MAGYWSAWKTTTSVLKWTRGCTAMPPCCSCRRPANETQISFYEIARDTPFDEIPYCLPSPRFRCAPNKGCNVAPWSRNGAALREMMHDDYPPPFVRKRDGARLCLTE